MVVFVLLKILFIVEIGNVIGYASVKDTSVAEDGNGGHGGGTVYVEHRLLDTADSVKAVAYCDKIASLVAGNLDLFLIGVVPDCLVCVVLLKPFGNKSFGIV